MTSLQYTQTIASVVLQQLEAWHSPIIMFIKSAFDRIDKSSHDMVDACAVIGLLSIKQSLNH